VVRGLGGIYASYGKSSQPQAIATQKLNTYVKVLRPSLELSLNEKIYRRSDVGDLKPTKRK